MANFPVGGGFISSSGTLAQDSQVRRDITDETSRDVATELTSVTSSIAQNANDIRNISNNPQHQQSQAEQEFFRGALPIQESTSDTIQRTLGYANSLEVRGTSHYAEAGITYTPATGDVTGLGTGLLKLIGGRVTTTTGTEILLSITDPAEDIPVIRRNGNLLQVNSFHLAAAADEGRRISIPLTHTSGTPDPLTSTPAVYAMPDRILGVTNETDDIYIEVQFVDSHGAVLLTGSGTIEFSYPITAFSEDETFTYGTGTAVVRRAVRVVGNDAFLDISLVSNSRTDVTVRVSRVIVHRRYTAPPGGHPRIDNWQTVSNGNGAVNIVATPAEPADYAFQIAPLPHVVEFVPAVRFGTTTVQCNDVTFDLQGETFDEVTLSSAEADRDIKITTVTAYHRHSELANILEHNPYTQWIWGYALLVPGGVRSEVQVMTPVILATGSKVGDSLINTARNIVNQPLADNVLGNADTGSGLIGGAIDNIVVGNAAAPSPMELRFDNSDSNIHRVMPGATYNATNGGLQLPAGHYLGVTNLRIQNTVNEGVSASTARAFPRVAVTVNPDPGSPFEVAAYDAYIRYASNATLTGLGALSYQAYVNLAFFFVVDGNDSLFVTITGQAQNALTRLTVSNCDLKVYKI